MISDIKIPEVKNVTIAVARKQNIGESPEWKVYLINNNEFAIENTLVASKGYGEKDGEPLIEPIDPGVFHLNNEYWVSYYIGTQIFDKRFVFVPDSIREENLSFVKELEMEAVVHS
jgi:hypothetical protein